MADRNGEMFFVCAIMSEHGLVAKEVILAENSDCDGSLGNLALLVVRPQDWICVAIFPADSPVVCDIFKTDRNLF